MPQLRIKTPGEAFDEAARRIHECKRTKSIRVDLNIPKLEETPDELNTLDWLEELSFGGHRWNDQKAAWEKKKPEKLDLRKWPDFSRLRNLRWLDLSRCCELTHSLSLEDALKYLGRAKIEDASLFAGLNSLQFLALNGWETIGHLTALPALPTLRTLEWNLCKLTDFHPLARLTGLRSLSLSACNRLTDARFLTGLRGLDHLSLAHCSNLADLKPLAGLENLQSLELGGEGLTDLRPLGNLHSLKSLRVSWCKNLADIGPLSRLHQLQHLTLWMCVKLADVSALARLHGLQSLVLSGSRNLNDVSCLAGMKNLRSLDLSLSRIKDASPLAELSKLRSLNAEFDPGTDLTPLGRLKSLESLTMSCAQPKTVEALKGLSRLRSLRWEWSDNLPMTPDWLDHWPMLKMLEIYSMPGAPAEVLSQRRESNRNCLSKLKAWRAAQKASTTATTGKTDIS